MRRTIIRKLVRGFLVLFVIMNGIVYMHAYRFTHFNDTLSGKTQKPEDLSWGEKFKTLFTGVQVPKPQNNLLPIRAYETFYLQSHEKLEGWDVPLANDKGLVILFHGYVSCKSNMLPYAQAFEYLGYSTMLVDFMGHGGSSGVETSIGYHEARDVKETLNYARKKYPEKKIILHGCSMGAVAIMKAVAEYDIDPDRIILECPFGSMLQTAKARFAVMGVPATPMAHWLVLFGGWQGGFNGFKHNPIHYATKIKVPTAVFNGANDARVSVQEVKAIYENLTGERTISFFENSGHQQYISNDSLAWYNAVTTFLGEE